jgi:hypothetical protein
MDHGEFIEGLIEKLVAEAAADRKTKGSMELGAARLGSRGRIRILSRTGSRNHRRRDSTLFAVALLKALGDAYSAFAAAFRIALEKLRRGDRGALFPEGCFPPALPFCV